MSDGLTEMYKEQMRLNDTTPADWEVLKCSAKDMVNSPPHYTQHRWETIEVLEEYFGNDPLLWQVGKYLLRCNYKGNTVQDLEKARWYLDRKINKMKGVNDA